MEIGLTDLQLQTLKTESELLSRPALCIRQLNGRKLAKQQR